jgi:hypothetical protein
MMRDQIYFDFPELMEIPFGQDLQLQNPKHRKHFYS